MAENSFLWTTTGAPAGHQVASYTQAQWSTVTKIMSACSGFEGVAPGYLNELACTYISANHCHVDTGGAVVDGKVYINDASGLGVTIDSATAGHYRIDRIVALCDWAAFTVTIAVKKNTVEDAAAPALTLTEDWTVSGTHYAILLYQASVTDAGVVTLTDERVWATPQVDGTTLTTSVGNLKIKDDGVDSAQIADGSVDLAHLSANSVDATKIVNRTRKVFINPRQDSASLNDGADTTINASWRIPEDYVSGMTVKFVCQPSGTGNIYATLSCYYGAVGEIITTHGSAPALSAVAVTSSIINEIYSTALANASIGDTLNLYFRRDATDPLDTVGAAVTAFGFVFEYTADS